MEEQELIALAQEKAKLWREWEQRKDSNKEPPEFNPVYRDSVEMAEEIAVHAELKRFPTRLFKKKAPNETLEQFNYRKENYKAKTRPFWNRACNVLNRVFNPQNYTIDWHTDQEDPLYKGDDSSEKYFTEEFPKYKSVISYFEGVVSNKSVNDPNAVLCVKPYKIPTTVNDAGEEIFNDRAMIEPYGVIYSSKQVIDYRDENWTLILLHEKSLVEFGNRKVKEGLIFEYYDRNQIWRIIQVGKKTDNVFEAKLYYEHNLDILPAWKLKGTPIEVEQEDISLYKSIFYDAVPGLDEALYDASTLSTATVTHAFPQYWEYSNLCRAEGCNDGYVGYGEDRKACSVCHGTGIVSKHSPTGTLQLLPEASVTNEGDTSVNTPPGGFISPDPGILEFLERRIERNSVGAFAMLNIDVSDSYVKGSETALGKKIDREEEFSLVMGFSNTIWDLCEVFVNTCGLMRYPKKFVNPTLNKPKDFAIRSESDLTEELKLAKEAGIPAIALNQITKQFMRTRFSSSESLTKRNDLVFAVDMLAMMDTVSIAAGQATGNIFKWQGILHTNINKYIDQKLKEDPEFLSMDVEEARVILEQMAKDDLAQNSNTAASELETIIEERQTGAAA